MKTHYSQAVALALDSDCPYSKIAEDLGVNYQTFGDWIRKAMSSSKSKSGKAVKPSKQNYQTLERELRAARKELDLRKKKIAFLLSAFG